MWIPTRSTLRTTATPPATSRATQPEATHEPLAVAAALLPARLRLEAAWVPGAGQPAPQPADVQDCGDLDDRPAGVPDRGQCRRLGPVARPGRAAGRLGRGRHRLVVTGTVPGGGDRRRGRGRRTEAAGLELTVFGPYVPQVGGGPCWKQRKSRLPTRPAACRPARQPASSTFKMIFPRVWPAIFSRKAS